MVNVGEHRMVGLLGNVKGVIRIGIVGRACFRDCTQFDSNFLFIQRSDHRYPVFESYLVEGYKIVY